MPDRIVTIEGGRLIEDGTHEKLIRTGGRYATLHRLQSGLPETESIGSGASHAAARPESRASSTLPKLTGHQPTSISSIRSHEQRRDAVG